MFAPAEVTNHEILKDPDFEGQREEQTEEHFEEQADKRLGKQTEEQTDISCSSLLNLDLESITNKTGSAKSIIMSSSTSSKTKYSPIRDISLIPKATI
ncbi:hypothetical protein Zmor_001269 [Zophobas morio]|nr:hypothetical protein Zmor_001269 [Zophobas morio]